MIPATKTTKEVDIFPTGSYPARIYQIIHIGTVLGYEGKLQNKVLITFEFPTELKVFDEKKGEQPRVLSIEATLSTHEKSGLTKIIKACDTKGIIEDQDYNVENLIGKACLVTVAHKKKKDGTGMYPILETFAPLPKGMVCPPQINPSKVLSFDNFDWNLFSTLPQFIQDAIKSSTEFFALKKPDASDGYPKETYDPNEVPF